MKKNVIALTWCFVVVLPVFIGLLFPIGPSILESLGICEGGVTWGHLIAVIYLGFISLVQFPAPKWIRDTVDAMVSE